jgi:hypothetical protein
VTCVDLTWNDSIAFHKFVIGLRRNYSYLLSQIGNADQTRLYFDMPTNDNRRERAKERNYPHRWMRKAALHCDARNNCGRKKVAAVCDI